MVMVTVLHGTGGWSQQSETQSMGPRSNHIVMGPVVKNGCFCHCSGNKWLSAISMPLSSSMYVKMRTQIYLLVRLPIFFFLHC